jgi:hypothetical protein
MALVALAYNFSSVSEIFYRLQGKLIRAKKIPPIHQRVTAGINPDGDTISLELALNSRCTSDYNGHQKIFHWGLFDPQKRLTSDDVRGIADRVQIPRFTDGLLEIKTEENMLHFRMANEPEKLKRSWMMIESGMQQQIVCLLCAAHGIGMVFKSLGDNGSQISDTIHANTRMKLDAMQPSYNGSYWCEFIPEGWRPWLKGNLPPPDRNGKKSLIGLVSGIGQNDISKKRSANIDEIGQLLWAARGRTPHYYKSRPWGMTIPVSGGNQNITTVFLHHSGHLFRYSNWNRGKPTHRLDELHGMKSESNLHDTHKHPNHNCHIILSGNENSGRALWEIGYQLINIILQAKAMELDVLPILTDQDLRTKLNDIEINEPWGIISMQADSLSL